MRRGDNRQIAKVRRPLLSSRRRYDDKTGQRGTIRLILSTDRALNFTVRERNDNALGRRCHLSIIGIYCRCDNRTTSGTPQHAPLGKRMPATPSWARLAQPIRELLLLIRCRCSKPKYELSAWLRPTAKRQNCCPPRLTVLRAAAGPSAWSNPSMSSTRPLSGITVIEIGHSVAAPYAGMILGELGAEVIKVENPKGGDACRGWGPPFTEGTATAFHAFNRAKRGITIDLGRPAAGADPRSCRRTDPQSQTWHARPIRACGRSASRREAPSRLLQSRRVRVDGAATRPAGLRPDDAGLWRADEPPGRGRAATGSGRRLDHRHGHRDVVGDRHPRGAPGTLAYRARRGGRYLALRDDARLDDFADLGLSRQWRNPEATRLGYRADRALSGVRNC